MTTRETSQPVKRVRVLLVDDHEEMLARAAEELKDSCTIVGTVTNGPAAIEAANALKPDVIVLDISMPGMTGLEVAAVLRDAGSTAAILFLTMHVEEEFMAVAREVGGLGYVFKPCLSSDLAVAVRETSAGRPFVSSRS